MVNKIIISESKTKSLPHFPELQTGKTKRVMTRHFCNLSLWLPTDELQLLNFLCYDNDTLANNTFLYSTQLLKRYCEAHRQANIVYGRPYVLKSLLHARKCMNRLIERGMILNTGVKNRFMLNPMITYNADVITCKQYKEVQELYQDSSPEKITVFTHYFINLVKQFLDSKKKNYNYGNKL